MKAVAYYRSRPGEPEASDLALRLQREAVQRKVEEHDLDLIAEFVEREGEEGSESWPAYTAAVQAAISHKKRKDRSDVALLIATNAPIGTGEPFEEPHLDGMNGLIYHWVGAWPTPAPLEIALPAGAPGPLCLYADYHPHQLEILVYLCNAGPGLLTEVTVETDNVIMGASHASKPGDRQMETKEARKHEWDAVLSGACVLLNALDHQIWGMGKCYRMTFTDVAGRRWTAEARDLSLNAYRLSQDPKRLWVAFNLIHPADQVEVEERPKGFPDV